MGNHFQSKLQDIATFQLDTQRIIRNWVGKERTSRSMIAGSSDAAKSSNAEQRSQNSKMALVTEREVGRIEVDVKKWSAQGPWVSLLLIGEEPRNQKKHLLIGCCKIASIRNNSSAWCCIFQYMHEPNFFWINTVTPTYFALSTALHHKNIMVSTAGIWVGRSMPIYSILC